MNSFPAVTEVALKLILGLEVGCGTKYPIATPTTSAISAAPIMLANLFFADAKVTYSIKSKSQI